MKAISTTRRRWRRVAAVLTAGVMAASMSTQALAAPSGTAESTGPEGSILKVTPSNDLVADAEAVVTLNGEKYGTSTPDGQVNGNGAYIFFGFVIPTVETNPLSWAPTFGGKTGVNYIYENVGGVKSKYMGFIDYSEMDTAGNWQLDFTIPGATVHVQDGDNVVEYSCFEVQCGIMTIGAHGIKNAKVENFTPVNFAAPEVAPTITTQPADQTVDEGTDATFSVVADGTPAPTYQWQVKVPGGDWTDKAGATEATFTMPAVTKVDQDGTMVRVVVTNNAGTVTSAEATLTVTSKTTIELDPQPVANHPTHYANEASSLKATISDTTVSGTVKFTVDGVEVASADVVNGVAQADDVMFTDGGAKQVVAEFTSTDGATTLTSEAQLFRVVDRAPLVDTVAVGTGNEVSEGELAWTFGNYYLDFFKSGFSKEVGSGNVKLGEMPDDGTKSATNQELIFHTGTGTFDKADAVEVDFTGTGIVRSGKDVTFEFTDPVFTVDAEGNGQLTALFTEPTYADASYHDQRQLVAEFTGATRTYDAATETMTIVATPMHEDHFADGTWRDGYTGGFPNAVLSAMGMGVRPFFFNSGSSSDPSKAPHDITVTFKVAKDVEVVDQPMENHPTDFADGMTTLHAQITGADKSGTVTFYVNGEEVGTADADADGKATLEVQLPGGGHAVTASIEKADGTKVMASEKTYRVVDLTPLVPVITMGHKVDDLEDATLTWSFGNYYLEFFKSGFKKGVESGNVTLKPAEEPADGQAATDQEIVFSKGIGSIDADGNGHILWSGSAFVTSGNALKWTFTNPAYTFSPTGGYLTAIFSDSMADADHNGQVVRIAEWQSVTIEDGSTMVTHTVNPIFADHTAAGTWSGNFTGGFPNEMLTNMGSGGRGFWYESGSSSDPSKSTSDLVVTYKVVEKTAPVITAQPADQTVGEGRTASFEVGFTSEEPATVTWWYQMYGSDEWKAFPGMSGGILELKDVTMDQDGMKVKAVVSSAGGEVVSEMATLTVEDTDPPTIAPLEDQTVPVGETAEFVVGWGSATPVSHIYWWAKAPGSDEWVQIDLDHDVMSVGPAALDQDGTQYKALVINKYGETWTNVATLHVTAKDGVAPGKDPAKPPTKPTDPKQPSMPHTGPTDGIIGFGALALAMAALGSAITWTRKEN